MLGVSRGACGRGSAGFRFQVSGVGSHWVSWSLRPFPAPASLFSAAAHTLGFYRTFEGRFNLSAFPNLGVYNLLGGEQRQAQVGPCVSTVPDYLNSGDILTLGESVCTANGRRSISNTLRQTKFVSTSIFEVVQVRVAPPRMVGVPGTGRVASTLTKPPL